MLPLWGALMLPLWGALMLPLLGGFDASPLGGFDASPLGGFDASRCFHSAFSFIDGVGFLLIGRVDVIALALGDIWPHPFRCVCDLWFIKYVVGLCNSSWRSLWGRTLGPFVV